MRLAGEVGRFRRWEKRLHPSITKWGAWVTAMVIYKHSREQHLQSPRVTTRVRGLNELALA